jgi:hypothetical protein
MSNNPEKKLIIVHSVYGTENPTEKSLHPKSNAGNRETRRCSALLPASSGEYPSHSRFSSQWSLP